MDAINTRSLRGRLEREAAVELYRATFGLADTDPAMTPKLLAALQHNGGSVVGAFDAEGHLVGFAYGFLGVDTGSGSTAPYHYSQAAVVAHTQQGRGIGRRLKLAQAEIARASGVPSMRWAYDPMLSRNAHFNLDVLGARGRWFHRDYYDQYADDHDAAGRTDRVVVEWDLTGDLAGAPAAQAPVVVDAGSVEGLGYGEVVELDPTTRMFVVPADWAAIASSDPERAGRVRDRVAAALEELLPAGWVVTSCRRVDSDRAAYLLTGPAGS